MTHRYFSSCFPAPTTFNHPLGCLRSCGTGILILPDKYAPVIEFSFFMISFAFPTATTSPPCSPAPGPISTILIRLHHCIFVMLYDYQRISQIHEDALMLQEACHYPADEVLYLAHPKYMLLPQDPIRSALPDVFSAPHRLKVFR